MITLLQEQIIFDWMLNACAAIAISNNKKKTETVLCYTVHISLFHISSIKGHIISSEKDVNTATATQHE